MAEERERERDVTDEGSRRDERCRKEGKRRRARGRKNWLLKNEHKKHYQERKVM